MRRSWMVVLAVSALPVVLGSPARADDPARPSGKAADPAMGPGKIEDPARVGRPGAGTERTRGAAKGAGERRELSGTVVKAETTTLYLEHMGAVVPLKVDEKTQFSGEGVKGSRDLTEGQEVRASFSVKDQTTNVADRITVVRGAEQAPRGGSGGQGMPPGDMEPLPPGHPPVPPGRGPGIPPDRQPVPRDPGIPTPADPGVPPVPPKY